MSADWPRVKISDVCDLIVDCVNKTAPKVEYETPYKMLRTPNIKNGKVDNNNCKFVTEEVFKKWTRRASVDKGDVLLTREAPLGQVGLVDFEDSVFLGQRIMQYRANPKVLDSKFLLYSFLSPDLQNQFRSHEGSGSVVSHIRVPDCSIFELNLPPLKVQQRIADILYSLDHKITLNRQINQTLESMAQTIFKSWFVDFEPVKAKIAALESGEDAEGVTRAAMRAISGKTDDELDKMEGEQAEEYAQLKSTAELFPSTMQDSELGEVPEGWTWKRADEICEISIGKTPPRKESQWFSSFPDGLKWVSIRDMGECGIFALDTSETLTHDAVKKFNVKRIPDNTLILSFKLTVGRVAITSGEMLTNEAIAHFIQKPEVNIPTSFYYLYLKQFDYNLLGSTSSIATAVNSKTIKALPIIMPPNDVICKFNVLMEPLFSQIKLVEEQNRELSKLRDTLLPKLLSGELSVDALKTTNKQGAQ